MSTVRGHTGPCKLLVTYFSLGKDVLGFDSFP